MSPCTDMRNREKNLPENQFTNVHIFATRASAGQDPMIINAVMSDMRPLTRYASLLLILAGIAAVQPTINAVVNAGSRHPAASPFYGIAQGALFAITGKGLGPDPLQQASFPLPTTTGLGGVTVQAIVGGATVDCILVYVSSGASMRRSCAPPPWRQVS